MSRCFAGADSFGWVALGERPCCARTARTEWARTQPLGRQLERVRGGSSQTTLRSLPSTRTLVPPAIARAGLGSGKGARNGPLLCVQRAARRLSCVATYPKGGLGYWRVYRSKTAGERRVASAHGSYAGPLAGVAIRPQRSSQGPHRPGLAVPARRYAGRQALHRLIRASPPSALPRPKPCTEHQFAVSFHGAWETVDSRSAR